MSESAFTYSRMVTFLKVILPLCALALLSTLFLLSRDTGGTSTDKIPFATVDLEQRAREQQVTAPFFSGKTKAGHLVAFTAESAKPDKENPEKSLAQSMDARIDLMDGSTISFSADRASIDNATQFATLDGNVLIVSSNGYSIRTDSLTTAMREVFAESRGTVTGVGPAGHIVAGQMRILPSGNPGEATLFFTKGVKLIYTPTE